MREINIPNYLIDSFRTLYLAGSYVEGFNTTTSDIDIYEICKDEHPKADRVWDYRKIQDIHDNGIHYEIELIPEKHISDLKKKVECSIKELDDNNFILSFHEFQMIWDIIIGVPIGDKTSFREYQTYFLEKKNQISILLVKQNGLFVRNAYEDILGLMQADDYFSAYFRSIDLLNRTADLLIAFNEILNTKTKWRYKKLGQAGLYTFQKKYYTFFAEKVIRSQIFIEEIIQFCHKEISKLGINKDAQEWIDLTKYYG
ncbi:nucleotidyltransferase domain-containing protein [Parasphaerochaeta coccoides]|uniref:Polymerase nucleotidyl transferase domain-containing protein n=1 Tax=Parasphaerochaeta coccoides (strain ATCC BAA-1237 / DSM 17374 / SPN1) TaxID=760011 RepID=F4GID3_PARC1|nr:nucleotidyltransferase domain-containing protein [Parasphaerochaeta coccoides]AEC01641.1 hypothetical protein Spico_0412 [Parasphaerochaeta coccoides DSM 17374]